MLGRVSQRGEKADGHGRRLARLLVRERRLCHQAIALRREIDLAVIAARRSAVPYKEIANEVVLALKLPPSADELERVTSCLRQRTKAAVKRAGGITAPTKGVAQERRSAKHGPRKETSMHPYRRRIIEEWFEDPSTCPPPGAPASIESDPDSDEDEPGLGEIVEQDHDE